MPSAALVLPYKERLERVQMEPHYSKSNISQIHSSFNHSPSTPLVGCFTPPVTSLVTSVPSSACAAFYFSFFTEDEHTVIYRLVVTSLNQTAFDGHNIITMLFMSCHLIESTDSSGCFRNNQIKKCSSNDFLAVG